MNNKSIFVIYHIQGYEFEGEEKKIVATRSTLEENIIEEVNNLNNKIKNVKIKDSNEWNYFDYEKLEIKEENNYENNFVFSSIDPELNLTGLNNFLMVNFDRHYDFYKDSEHLQKNITLREHIENLYQPIFGKEMDFDYIMEIVKTLNDKKLIASNIDEIMNVII